PCGSLKEQDSIRPIFEGSHRPQKAIGSRGVRAASTSRHPRSQSVQQALREEAKTSSRLTLCELPGQVKPESLKFGVHFKFSILNGERGYSGAPGLGVAGLPKSPACEGRWCCRAAR